MNIDTDFLNILHNLIFRIQGQKGQLLIGAGWEGVSDIFVVVRIFS